MLRYKACRNSIVTLKLLNSSITNEKRLVIDENYAKFRCDRARVIDIVNVKTGEKMVYDASIWNKDFKYKLGKMVIIVNYDFNMAKVCASGIHYFKTKEATLSWFYRQNDNFPDGKWTCWYENGQKQSEGTYKDDEHDGKWIYWHENGNKESESTYKNGIQDGKWTQWWNDGSEVSEKTYQRYF